MKLFLLLLVLSIPIFAEKSDANSIKVIITDTKPTESSWGSDKEIESFKNVQILEELSEENSKAALEEARNSFNNSIVTMKTSEKDIKEKSDKMDKEVRRQDKYEWQIKARESEKRRILRNLEVAARRKAIVDLVRAMNSLDKIQNPTVITSEVYLDLKASIFRNYIKHQMWMKNINPAMDVLEKFIGLGPKYEKEPEAHKLLAICYEHNEKFATRHKSDNDVQNFRFLKNKHILRFAELAYGKDSNQYDRIVKKLGKY